MKTSYDGFCISDIHWGNGNSKQLNKELRENFLDLVQENVDELDFIMICGDYFHMRLNTNANTYKLAVAFFYELLTICQKNNIKLRLIHGTVSHDYNQTAVFKMFEATHSCFRLIKTVSREELFDGFKVLYLPEEYPKNSTEYYAEFFDEKYDAIFGHGTCKFQAFASQKIESEKPIHSAPVFDEKELVKLAKVVIFGHIHVRADYKQKMFYCGSFSRHGFGEEGKKGFIYLEYDTTTKKHEVSYIDNELAPQYKTVNLVDIMDEDTTLEETKEIIDKLSKEFPKLRINAAAEDIRENSLDIAILKESIDADSVVINTKVQKHNTETRELGEFEFIIDPALLPLEKVCKFIEIKEGVKYSVEELEDVLDNDSK